MRKRKYNLMLFFFFLLGFNTFKLVSTKKLMSLMKKTNILFISFSFTIWIPYNYYIFYKYSHTTFSYFSVLFHSFSVIFIFSLPSSSFFFIFDLFYLLLFLKNNSLYFIIFFLLSFSLTHSSFSFFSFISLLIC